MKQVGNHNKFVIKVSSSDNTKTLAVFHLANEYGLNPQTIRKLIEMGGYFGEFEMETIALMHLCQFSIEEVISIHGMSGYRFKTKLMFGDKYVYFDKNVYLTSEEIKDEYLTKLRDDYRLKKQKKNSDDVCPLCSGTGICPVCDGRGTYP